jgi:hypothetical protein
MKTLPYELQYFIRDKLPITDKYQITNLRIKELIKNNNIFKSLFTYLSADTTCKLFNNIFYSNISRILSLLYNKVNTHIHTSIAARNSSYMTTSPCLIRFLDLLTAFDIIYYGFKIPSSSKKYENELRPTYYITSNKSRQAVFKYHPPSNEFSIPTSKKISSLEFKFLIKAIWIFQENMTSKKYIPIIHLTNQMLYQFHILLNYLHRKYYLIYVNNIIQTNSLLYAKQFELYNNVIKKKNTYEKILNKKNKKNKKT